ncbi:MAG: PASTA domain-containing protein, partial [Bacilli bacterium]|nr:PASTA domain-containing protein [Bacilli bacterium]
MKRVNKMPDLIGLTVKEAQEIFKENNINNEIEVGDKFAFRRKGLIAKTVPSFNEDIKKDDKIKLYKSRGFIFLLIPFLILFTFVGVTTSNIIMNYITKPAIESKPNTSKDNYADKVLVSVIKDSKSSNPISHYEYCITDSKKTNNCEWKVTKTKNFYVDRNGHSYVFVRGVDKKNHKSSPAKLETYIDNNNPMIDKVDIINTTDTTIKVKVSAHDNESGIKKYYYSLDDKNWYEGNDEYEFNSLTPNTKYPIYIKVLDNNGNVYSVITDGKTLDKSANTDENNQTDDNSNDNNDNSNNGNNNNNNNNNNNQNNGDNNNNNENNQNNDGGNNNNGGDNNQGEGGNQGGTDTPSSWDIPKIDLSGVPAVFTLGEKYDLPTSVDFGNDSGTYTCVVEGQEYKDTSTIKFGKHLIVCNATSSHNKRTMVTKDVMIELPEGEEELFDGYIKLNLYYPEDSTNRQWRLDDSECSLPFDTKCEWQDYTGPIVIRIDQTDKVYLRYDVAGETYIVPPTGEPLIDIDIASRKIFSWEKTKVNITYDKVATLKQYRINGGEWIDYNGEFEVGPDTLIEARVRKEEKVFNNLGEYQYTQPTTKTASKSVELRNIIGYTPPIDPGSEEQGGETDDPSDPGSGTGGTGETGENPPSDPGSGTGGTGETGENPPSNPDGGTHVVPPLTDEEREDLCKIYTCTDPTPTHPEPKLEIEGPIIKHNPSSNIVDAVAVVITSPEEGTIYYSVDYGEYKKYEGPFMVEKNTYVRSYYVRKEDGLTSKTTWHYISNIKVGNLPYVSLSANPSSYLTEEVDKVTVTVNASDYDQGTLEYSFDNIMWYPYTAPIEVTNTTTIYARATNKYGTRQEYTHIYTKSKPVVKEKYDISISTNPRKEDVEGLINKTTVSISYDSRATHKYYMTDRDSTWKEYTGEFEVRENTTVYAYCTSDNGSGYTYKGVDFLTTGIMTPIIRPNTTSKAYQVYVEMDFDKNADVKKYKIDDGEWQDYNGPFYVFENCSITAYNSNVLGYSKTKTRYITNIVPQPEYVIADMGSYYVIRLNYPSISVESTREYKWMDNGTWKTYDKQGILLIKQEYKDDYKDIKDGIKVKYQGKELTFKDHYYFLEGPLSEVMGNIFMRWNIVPPAEPSIVGIPSRDPVKEVTMKINYQKNHEQKKYKIVEPDGTDSGWLDYNGEFKITKNNTVIYAKGINSAELESTVASYKISNIDEIDPTVKVRADLETPRQRVPLTIIGEDNLGVAKVKWAKGSHDINYFDNIDAVSNGRTVYAEENGVYTFYVEDHVGRKAIKEVEVTNVDKNAPNIIISVLTEQLKDNVDISIDYGDSDLKQYSIGDDKHFKDYTDTINIRAYDYFNNRNTDGSLTIYAKGRDIAGNERVITEKIYTLDLNKINNPIINSITSTGVGKTAAELEATNIVTIEYDNSDGLSHYYCDNNCDDNN